MRKIVFSILILLGFTPVLQCASSNVSFGGPLVDSLIVKSIPQFGEEIQVSSLQSGQIDLIPMLVGSQKVDVSSNPKLKIVSSIDTTVAYLFFNTRRSPGSEQSFREAFSRLINREYICKTLENGDSEPLLTFAPATPRWINSTATAPVFDTRVAAKTLDDSGYTLDTISGWRINPKTGKTLEVVLLTPTQTSRSTLWNIGYTLTYYANALGIRCTHLSLPDNQLLIRTMEERDFDVLIQYVPLTRSPFGLYVMLHSSQNVNGTSDYSGIVDEDLDSNLETLWSGVDESKCISAALKAQARLSELLPCAPILTPKIKSAINEAWVGVVVLPGIGSDNIWSYLSLHKNGQPYGGTLTSSIIGKIATLNPCIADSTNEWGILQLIYSPLLYVDPVSGEDTPMLAESWSTEAWTSPNGSDGMKVTFKLRNNVLWQDGVPFTSHDIKFCVDYLKERDVPRYRSICTNIEKVETLDDTTVIIYLNEPGYRLLYALNWFTFMPEHIWKNVPDYTQYKPWSEDKPDTIGLTKLVGQGPFIIKKSDLKGDITLYWNPLYFMTNTDKPGLVKKDTTPTTAIVGEKVTFSYIVSNNTGSPLRAASANFTLSVKRGDQSTALEQKVTYQNEKYVALVDSAKLAPGEYTCIFSAIPFGSTSSQLVILKQTSTATNTTQPTDTTKPTTPSPSGVPGYPIEVITSGILLATLSLIILKKSRTRN